ncbi:MAG: hypothetical protein AABZ80_09620 [Gemmatimonadota bacterium]
MPTSVSIESLAAPAALLSLTRTGLPGVRPIAAAVFGYSTIAQVGWALFLASRLLGCRRV